MNARNDCRLIAVIGGTGKEGKGLAFRFCRAGHRVLIGSRSMERAAIVAAELVDLAGGGAVVQGLSNEEAARQAEIVVLTVPYAAHRAILESIQADLEGKLLIDATVPLVAGRPSRAHMPPAGSAALESREILGANAEIAAAFHSISHEGLLGEGHVDCDVLVTGSSKQARTTTLELIAAASLDGWDAGALENSAVTEGMTSVLIHINRVYGSAHAGIRITGVNRT
jgi:NADPH-dependent F420 reductase